MKTIDVWKISLEPEPFEDDPEGILPPFWETLSEDERERAARFLFQKDRRRFALGRWALRSLLGRYLEEEPRRIRFRYSPNGRPEISPGISPEISKDLRFNLSHSEGFLVCAFLTGGAVGIDVERTSRKVDMLAIARRHFFPREVSLLESLPEAEQRDIFFTLWTLKEAAIKARGDSLADSLDHFEILSRDDSSLSIQELGRPAESGGWFLKTWRPATDYVAGLAVPGDEAEVRESTVSLSDLLKGIVPQ